MAIELEDCWLRWRRGETIESLAKEYGVTRERMFYRLDKLDQTHPAMLREAALEEAEDVVAEVGDHADVGAYINAIRALKNQNPDSAALTSEKEEKTQEDPECTGCGGTGVTYQTERRCACQQEVKHG